MTTFMQTSETGRTALLCGLLLLLILQLSLMLLLFRRRKPTAFALSAAGAALTCAVLAALTAQHLGMAAPWTCRIKPPFVILTAAAGALAAVTAARLISELLRDRQTPDNSSIKEAVDNLPAGICFFSKETGRPVLCNRTMRAIAFDLTGRDLQSISDLTGALDELPLGAAAQADTDRDTFLLPDGRVLSFSEAEASDEYGNRYIEITAHDVTELCEATDKLEKRRAELLVMRGQLNRITENVAAITREEEILAAKMRVHNRLGSCMLLTRRYYAQNCPEEKKDALLTAWRDTLAVLSDEIGREDEVDAMAELVRVARTLGVEIAIDGEMPEDAGRAYILVLAMRECLTNTLRHAEGTRINAALTRRGRTVTAVITNNGRRPEQEITEGGGLMSLRKKTEDAGGRMYVDSLPQFALHLMLPAPVDGGRGSESGIW